ncbi:MAG: ShlB/FhaC/HecB family hemolysin secretion/activation protein [Aquabacterium sp.]|nr:ShlB/FhaC/HecB family hemolysin secretion/activation protein [Aquabacterium sp.]
MSLLALAAVGLVCSGAAQAQAPAFDASAVPAASAAPAQPRFDILEFIVEGDTLLGAAAIERAVYPFLGPQRTVDDAEGARKALEAAYQAAGYLSVSVLLPPQRVDNAGGEVRLLVQPAVIDKLRVTGAQYTLPSKLREALPSLAPGQAPDFHAMQDELAALARRSTDREVTPLLAAGSRPNTLDVELKVQESAPLNGHVELNSKRALGTVAGRLEAGIRWDNLFQRDHSIGIDWVVSPRKPSQSNIQNLLYNLPLGGVGDRLFITFTHSDSDTPTALGGTTVSRGDTLRLRWRDELPRLGAASQALSWGLTLRDLRDGNRNVAGFTTPSTPLRYPSFSLAWDLDLPGSGQPGRITRLGAEFNASVRGLSARTVDCGTGADAERQDQFSCKRSGASPGFQVLGFSASHTEPLGQWQLMARLQGQLTDAPLVPAEQLVFGGEDSARGYFEGEQAGDLGAALRLELSAPAWAPAEGLQLQALAFHDLAQLHKLEALPGELRNVRLHSLGLGLRLDTRYGLSAALTWSQVLRATSKVGGSGGAGGAGPVGVGPFGADNLGGGVANPAGGAGPREAATARGQRLELSLRQRF